MIAPPTNEKRLFVLDTNVLMHDPTAIYRFEEHDIFLPMVVLEELDAGKKGSSDIARNVRQATRFLNELIEKTDQLGEGIPLPAPDFVLQKNLGASGRLLFQTEIMDSELPTSLPGSKADNEILRTAIALHKTRGNVTLVSKDINLRVKAAVVGIHAEDYFNDRVLDDVSLLYGGIEDLPKDFWDRYGQDMDSWHKGGRSFYRVQGDIVENWHPNQCLTLSGDKPFDALVREIEEDSAVLEFAHDFQDPKHSVWGIRARNQEQNFALNLLMDPDVDFVSLTGIAGTGKTLLALAAGLHQTMEDKRYREIVLTREAVPVGEDIGFLPGTEEEKMTPWMGALMDNLEVLTHIGGDQTGVQGSWTRAAANDLLQNRIKIRSVNFMRGRTFNQRFIIIDEAQNLTSKQMKTLITRAGPGSKIVCLGNLEQIDTPYLSETTSGLTYVVDRFKNWNHSGHITLIRGERSRLAEFASDVL
ncbi:MAG: PhoH family protein [Gammaproteobacteria bacterium]